MEKIKKEISLKLHHLFERIESDNPELSFETLEPEDITIEPEHIELKISAKNRVNEKKKVFPAVLLNFSKESLSQLESEIKTEFLE
jgi:hypothetical protein